MKNILFHIEWKQNKWKKLNSKIKREQKWIFSNKSNIYNDEKMRLRKYYEMLANKKMKWADMITIAKSITKTIKWTITFYVLGMSWAWMNFVSFWFVRFQPQFPMFVHFVRFVWFLCLLRKNLLRAQISVIHLVAIVMRVNCLFVYLSLFLFT